MEQPRLLASYIAGQWITSPDATWGEDRNPSDLRQILAYVPNGNPGQVDDAVAAAQAATRTWGRASGPEHASALHRIATLMSERRDLLARAVALEVGKPIGEASAEVDRGVAILRYFAEEAVHPQGLVIPAQTATALQFTLRQPLGVVAVISPWNFPLAIPLWKMAPALAFGNTIVWKPAEVASLVASHLVELIDAARLPAGTVNLVLGKGSTTGAALVAHPGIQAITFTGSDSIGKQIAQQAAQRNIKYQLEMGGKNAAIVLADADLDQAAQLVAAGAMRFAGQKCTATSRVIVVEAIYEQFATRLATAIAALPVRVALDPTCAVGPLISAEALASTERYAQEAAQMGKIVVGGQRLTEAELAHGAFFSPTVVTDVAPDAPVAQEEVFGPLLALLPAQTLGHAITLANGTRYGLSVSLFTRDLNAALEYVREIACGMVRVNGDTTGVDPHAPFGGMRGSSSHSREQGPAAMDFFTEIKTIQISRAEH